MTANGAMVQPIAGACTNATQREAMLCDARRKNSEMKPLIHYWGPAGAGKSTSIKSLLATDSSPFGDLDYHTLVGSVPVVLRFSSLLCKYYYEADSDVRPKAIEPAIQTLEACAAIVFVADSQVERRWHNQGALKRLRADFRLVGLNLDDVPVVFQLNKRDLPDCIPSEVMRTDLQTAWCEYFESVAISGKGTFEAVAWACAQLSK